MLSCSGAPSFKCSSLRGTKKMVVTKYKIENSLYSFIRLITFLYFEAVCCMRVFRLVYHWFQTNQNVYDPTEQMSIYLECNIPILMNKGFHLVIMTSLEAEVQWNVFSLKECMLCLKYPFSPFFSLFRILCTNFSIGFSTIRQFFDLLHFTGQDGHQTVLGGWIPKKTWSKSQWTKNPN